MTYPAKPVLIGKVVRCKGCRNAFILQADGIATKAAPEAPQPAPAPVPSPTRPSAPVEPVPVIQPATPPPAAPTPAPASPSRPITERNPRKKSEQLEAARVKMAADLAAVAAKAAESEVAKREERRSERLTKTGATGEGGKLAQHTVVLTGEGDRLHHESLRWALGALVVVGVLALIVVAFSLRSSARAALDAYTAAVPSSQNRYPDMGAAVRARAWVIASPSQPSGPQIASALPDAIFGSEWSLDLGPLATRLAELKGLRFAADLNWWVAPADRARLAAAFAGQPAAERLRIALTNHIPAVDHAAWLKKLELSTEERVVLMQLIAGQAPPGGVDFPKRMLDDGDLPERVHLRGFSGRRGEMRIDVGPPAYLYKVTPYRGTLMRFTGVGWPTGWRVLDLQTER